MAARPHGGGRGAPGAVGRGPRRGPRRRRGGDARRRRKAPAPDAGPAQRRAAGRRGRDSGRDRDRARPHGDPRSRRRARRGAASPRAPDRGGSLGPGPGAGRRGPAVLAGLRRAWRSGKPAAGGAPVQGLGGACARRARPATGCLRRHDFRRALPRALRAEDGAAVRVRLLDRSGGRLRGRLGRRWRPPGGARDLRSRDRPRLPAPRRRARRHRPAGADREGPRDRPAGWDRDPAVDPRSRARSNAWPSSGSKG